MALRMIELAISKDAAGDLDEAIGEIEPLGVWRGALDEDLMLVRVLVSSERSESVIDALESRFHENAAFRLLIFEVAATVPTPDVDERENDRKKKDKPDSGDEEPERVAVAELVEELSSGAKVNRAYILMVLLSAVVAAVGLMRDNVAVIIGAMVIAPLLAPNMTLALATTLGDLKLARSALFVNVVGFILALLVATLAGMLVPFDPTVREIATRTDTSLSDIAVALAAGVAGVLAFTTGVSATLVGVMVAVALLPPLVAAGLLLGSGDWFLASKALLLVATNVICINLAAVGAFLFQRVRPRYWWEAERARKMVLLASVVWVLMLAALVGLIMLAQQD